MMLLCQLLSLMKRMDYLIKAISVFLGFAHPVPSIHEDLKIVLK